MKNLSLTAAALLCLPLFAAVKMNVSGQKTPAEVTEKDGVYTVAPQSRTRIQLFPKTARIQILPGAQLEVSAEVSGSGNIQLGAHLYNSAGVWSGAVGSKMIRIDSEDNERIKAVVKADKEGIVSVLPWISVHSGKVSFNDLSVKLIGALDRDDLEKAPKLPGWSYAKSSKALKCVQSDGMLQIVTGRGQTVEMMSQLRPAKDGDVLKFTGKVSGKGRLRLGVHLYNKSNVWQGTLWQEHTPAAGSADKLPTVTVKTPAGKEPAAFVRAVIRVSPGSEVELGKLDLVK